LYLNAEIHVKGVLKMYKNMMRNQKNDKNFDTVDDWSKILKELQKERVVYTHFLKENYAAKTRGDIIKNNKATVKVNFTEGTGNKIFQYIYARLLAEHYDLNFSSPRLDILEIPETKFGLNKKYKTIFIPQEERNWHKYFSLISPCNFIVETYPEDFTLYKPHMNRIRSWFNDIPKTNTDDLVFHLRLGDRLLNKNDHHPSMKVTAEEYIHAIERFDFDKLHIVTDMHIWKKVTPEEIQKMEFPMKVPKKWRVEPSIAASYFNSLVEAFNELDPIVRFGHTVKDDFNFIRSFDKILIQHGTLSWWAAALSHASKVGVFGPWQPIMGEINRNLGRTDFEGWFQWGNE
jgi:hypothetical protein